MKPIRQLLLIWAGSAVFLLALGTIRSWQSRCIQPRKPFLNAIHVPRIVSLEVTGGKFRVPPLLGQIQDS